MKKIIVILILTLFLTGCFSYKDVNRVVFVTSLGIDIDEDNNTIIYAEAFSSLRGVGETSEEEGRVVFRGIGNTIYEAIRNLFASSSLRLNFTQNKAIIFSERAAKYGLDNFLDTLIRDQEFLVRQYLYISKVDLEELMKIKLQEEKYLGIFLADLSENRPSITKRPQMRIDEFLICRKLGSKINAISIIEKDHTAITERIFIKKLAVFKEDKMINELNYDETFYYNIAVDELKTGFIQVPNPDEKGKLMDFEILKTKTKTHINYDGENIDVKKEINMEITVAYAQITIHLNNKKDREKLSKYAAEDIKKGCLDLYNKYKDIDVDIFNLKRHIDAKYPHADIDETLNSVNLIIEPNIRIEGSSDITNFY
ncbi:Ger(x)C family spore germination protein [Alkaliphilus sp. MSJ-5]|uniref:Ger(X)C family spore germination protein n=1 Tax=Alkaliphilus flagellatus TaxID=2841507 RepID=A0ABS6FXG5_9FIRM|nr:Ger(x)C family spore germination protein [Alkaliphilus flagellatus]MBU5674922.1 Ger(x)C family spore germination protein [Alkaliphilus flagellatus]